MYFFINNFFFSYTIYKFFQILHIISLFLAVYSSHIFSLSSFTPMLTNSTAFSLCRHICIRLGKLAPPPSRLKRVKLIPKVLGYAQVKHNKNLFKVFVCAHLKKTQFPLFKIFMITFQLEAQNTDLGYGFLTHSCL